MARLAHSSRATLPADHEVQWPDGWWPDSVTVTDSAEHKDNFN